MRVDLVSLRTADLEAVALFALGRIAFVFKVRPFTDDFAAGRRVAVREIDRLKPFVTGLLIRRRLQIEGLFALQKP